MIGLDTKASAPTASRIPTEKEINLLFDANNLVGIRKLLADDYNHRSDPQALVENLKLCKQRLANDVAYKNFLKDFLPLIAVTAKHYWHASLFKYLARDLPSEFLETTVADAVLANTARSRACLTEIYPFGTLNNQRVLDHIFAISIDHDYEKFCSITGFLCQVRPELLLCLVNTGIAKKDPKVIWLADTPIPIGPAVFKALFDHDKNVPTEQEEYGRYCSDFILNALRAKKTAGLNQFYRDLGCFDKRAVNALKESALQKLSKTKDQKSISAATTSSTSEKAIPDTKQLPAANCFTVDQKDDLNEKITAVQFFDGVQLHYQTAQCTINRGPRNQDRALGFGFRISLAAQNILAKVEEKESSPEKDALTEILTQAMKKLGKKIAADFKEKGSGGAFFTSCFKLCIGSKLIVCTIQLGDCGARLINTATAVSTELNSCVHPAHVDCASERRAFGQTFVDVYGEKNKRRELYNCDPAISVKVFNMADLQHCEMFTATDGLLLPKKHHQLSGISDQTIVERFQLGVENELHLWAKQRWLKFDTDSIGRPRSDDVSLTRTRGLANMKNGTGDCQGNVDGHDHFGHEVADAVVTHFPQFAVDEFNDHPTFKNLSDGAAITVVAPHEVTVKIIPQPGTSNTVDIKTATTSTSMSAEEFAKVAESMGSPAHDGKNKTKDPNSDPTLLLLPKDSATTKSNNYSDCCPGSCAIS